MNTPNPAEPCRVCGSVTASFAHARLLTRHEVRYDRCPQCGLIQTEPPYWLAEAYSEAIAGSDTGLLRRNFILSAVTQSVIRSYFRPHGRFVDYGGGYGALVRLMRDAGFDFQRHDPMCANLFARGFDAAPPAQPDCELVTAFEVFEHLVNPRQELAKMLTFSRNILFTTLLQPYPAPQPGDWWYYCLDTGQHVALYTRSALEALGRTHGLNLVTDGKQLHLFTEQKIAPSWFKLISRYRVARLRTSFAAGSARLAQDHEAAPEPPMAPVKILFDYQVFLAQRYGGISRYFVELIRELAGRPDCDITVLAGLHRNELLASLPARPGLRIVGWRLPRWLPGRRLYGGINRCFFALAAPRIGPDIYHATYYKVLAPRLRTRRVFTVYDMIHELHPGPLAARDPTPRRKQQAVQRADHLVCISRHTRDDLIRLLGVAAGKTTVTHLAGSLRATPRAGRPHPQPYLLYVGDRDGYKNADLVGRTLASQPDLRPQFHLVFFGGPPFTRAEQQRLTDLGLGGQTHRVTGSDEDLATWYAHAFALVYPSHYEGFGIPPLEAMQYGCPVLASDRSSLPEVVGEAARLFDPDSETSLADALRELVDNPAERADLLCKGQQHHQWFTWKACADRTQSVYASLMPPPAHHE